MPQFLVKVVEQVTRYQVVTEAVAPTDLETVKARIIHAISKDPAQILKWPELGNHQWLVNSVEELKK